MQLRIAFGALALTLPLFAADPLSGTWILQPNTSSGTEWAQYDKDGDAIRWSNSGPATLVFKIDGNEHPSTSGRSTVTWMQIDNYTLENVIKEAGKVTSSSRVTFSPDGNTRTVVTQVIDGPGAPYDYTVVSKRTADGPSDSANLLIGRWDLHERTVRGNFPVLTIEVNENKIRHEGPTTYEAAFDGKEYPVKGFPDGESVVVRRIDEQAIEHMIKGGGKVISTTRLSVSRDGKTLTRTFTRAGGVTTNVYARQ